MNKDYFKAKAGTYESDSKRVTNVDNIANAIIETVKLHTDMHIMDFGSGTGLLLERIAPYVAKITAVDISQSMNAQLEQKRERLACELEILEVDLVSEDIPGKFDAIVSSMTMHHVNDTLAMFQKFSSLLKDGGVIAISDLDREDGSFHTEDTGVYHAGFDLDEIAGIARQAGFNNVAVRNVSVVQKPHRNYPVFLLTANK